jgi:ribosome-associated protein
MENNLITMIKEWIEIKKGFNIRIYDVKERVSYTDTIIVCEGDNSLHIRAIADNILEEAKKNKINIYSKEGVDNAKWILLDLSDIIVHIFDTSTRKYYQLDELLNLNQGKGE